MTTHRPVPTITFIGMSAAGKMKVGKELSRLLGRDFVDIDDRIVHLVGGNGLEEIVKTISPDEFAALENYACIRTVVNLARPTIIATGGSMIYHEHAMEVLSRETCIIYLRATLETIARRVAKDPARGIVFAPGETLGDLYARRVPLYEKWAHQTVCADGKRRDVARELAETFRAPAR